MAGEKTKNESSMSKMAAEGVSVEYQENSTYSFKNVSPNILYIFFVFF